jgi:beta-lactamase class A
MKATVLGLAFVLSIGCSHGSALQDSLAHTATASAPAATVAVTVLDLSTGARSSVHGDLRLPMMSVFKLPLTVAALDAVDHRELALSQPIPIAENELVPNVSPIAEAWKKGEHAPKLEVVLTRMIQDSDNTAGDKMVSVLGGGPSVTSRLRALGIEGIDIGEPEINISARLSCPSAAMPPGGWTAPAVDACPEASAAERIAAARRELAAAPNAASTDALVALLERLDRGTLLSDTSRRWLLATLAGTTTGPNRIKGLLPPGTPVAHKTGTGGVLPGLFVATNDVGIVTMPSGRRFAIGVLVTGSRRPLAEQELAIATLARVAWDSMNRR